MQTSFIERRIANWLLRRTPVSGVRKVVSAFGAVASEIGNVRNENQDKAAIVKSIHLSGQPYIVAVVADGIGGMRDGSQCAALAIAAFVSRLEASKRDNLLYPEEWLKDALHAANASVFERYGGNGGSTFVVLLLLRQGGVYWASAGDSRLYRFSDRKLTQISVDDTIAGQLGKRGPVPAEHSKILQFVGMGKDFVPHIGKETWGSETQYLLTTDGVHYLSEFSGMYARVIEYSDEIGVTAKRLIDLAKWCGGPDNATTAILSLPTDPSDLISDYDEGLSMWDAFGELQIQVVDHEHGNEPDRHLSTTVDQVQEASEIYTSPLIESESGTLAEQTPDTSPNGSTSSQKKSTKKKRPPKDAAKAQLDIRCHIPEGDRVVS